MGLGSMEILAIVLIVFAMFGAGRVPGIMENFGKGIRSFKEGLKDDDQNRA